MQIKKYNTPWTRDPFVNTPLIPAGYDPETGEERFWISTWNSNAGCVGVLMTPSGKNRVYRFAIGEGLAGMGAYSAVYVGNETMWLMSDLGVIRRMDLTTGAVEEFTTGVEPGHLVFSGAQYDEKTGKLLFAAGVAPGMKVVSFDTKTCKTVKVYSDFCKATGSHGGFHNPDGTYCMTFETNEPSIWRWNPETDEFTLVTMDCKFKAIDVINRISDASGRHYIPNVGWCDGYTIDRTMMPEKEALWFGRHGTDAYGYVDETIWHWDMTTGKVTRICGFTNGHYGFAVTGAGEILTFNIYGELCRYSADGVLLLSRKLDTDACGHVDCLIAADGGIIVGTPFITQRFWIYDETADKGYDAGRAAPGSGEVLQVWNKFGKIYMAAYTQGYLTEFDPTKPANYPENPRLVALPPNAMRPVAKEEDDRHLYYACNHHYSHLGCTMTKYDALTGEVLYVDDPIEGQAIRSLYLQGNTLWAGTTWQSDCRSTFEPSRDCFLAKMSVDTLLPEKCYPTAEGLDAINILGEWKGKLILAFHGRDCHVLKLFDPETETYSDLGDIPEKTRMVCRGEAEGECILLRDGKIERWTISEDGPAYVATILTDPDIYRISIAKADGKPVLCAAKKMEFYVIRDFA